MRKVLVTGAGGFVGSHLAADQARRGYQVVAYDIHLGPVAHLHSPQFELWEGNICDQSLLKQVLAGVDTVFHLAAEHLSVRSKESDFWRVNVDAVRDLIEAARQAGVRRFVHCSSAGVYGRIVKPPANEDTPCFPEISYEKSKLAGEKVVLEAVQSKRIPAVILRPVWVYGPGCSRTEKLFRSIAKGRFLLAGRANTLRHCIYIRDMVEAFQLASLSDDAVGHVMVVGDHEAVTVRELVSRIAEVTGARLPYTVPLAVLYVAGLLAEIAVKPTGKEPPLSRRTLKFFTGNAAFDITRARQLLGFEPKYDLLSGLRETHEFWSGRREARLPLPDPVII